MNPSQGRTKKIILTVFLSIIVITVLIVLFAKKQIAPKISPVAPTITPFPQNNSEINPSYKKNMFIPTYTPNKGSGVDLQAPLVADSMKEIQKLYPFLPYVETINANTDQEVDIVVPDKTSQPNPWTLHVNISGLDYNVAKGDQNYIPMKNAFINATSSVYKWIQDKGADPKKIMIIWGDKEVIQNKSQEWLE